MKPIAEIYFAQVNHNFSLANWFPEDHSVIRHISQMMFGQVECRDIKQKKLQGRYTSADLQEDKTAFIIT